jgi:hypothetical protein
LAPTWRDIAGLLLYNKNISQSIIIEPEVPMREKEIQSAIKTVYGKLWDLLSLYEVTDCFNEVPDKADKDIWNYLGKRLLDIRKDVNMLFLGQQDIMEKLTRIVDETEFFIRQYEVPGAVMRWKQVNPRLLYFDCTFEIMEEDPETYKMSRRGLTDVRLNCYPDEELIKDRKAYFRSIEEKNNQANLRYSEKRLFQNELLHTLTILFEADFEEYL